MLSNEALFRTVIVQILVFTIHEENHVEITQQITTVREPGNPRIILRNKILLQPEVNCEKKARLLNDYADCTVRHCDRVLI